MNTYYVIVEVTDKKDNIVDTILVKTKAKKEYEAENKVMKHDFSEDYFDGEDFKYNVLTVYPEEEIEEV